MSKKVNVVFNKDYATFKKGDKHTTSYNLAHQLTVVEKVADVEKPKKEAKTEK